MQSESKVVLRPRKFGEIIDDALALYLTEAPLLLLLTGSVFVPTVALFLILLTNPCELTGPVRWLLAVGLATLIPVGGLTTGACQEIFHCWAEKQPTGLNQSLRAAWKRGWNHITCQALMSLGPVATLLC